MSGAVSPSGSGVLAALKQKMHNLREELEKYKDLYEDKCRDLEAQLARHDEVGPISAFDIFEQLDKLMA